MKYQVRVKSTKNGTVRKYWFRLRRFGLRKDRFGAYAGEVRSRRRLEKLKAYCAQKHLYFRIDNEYGKRGSSYRAIFFRTHKPALFGCYFCAYCGRLLRPRNVSVDHLYPVGSACRDPDMQEQLKKLHIGGINDPKNLVAACRRCNQEKGKKMGEWIPRGKRGRHAWYWMLRWSVRMACLLLFTAAAAYLLVKH